MNKTLITLALLGATSLASAQSWRLLPVLDDPNFKLEPTIALTVGQVNPDDARDATNWGLELNVNCGLFQSPDNRIRTYLQLNRSSEDGLRATAFEVSPRYTVPLGQGWSLGAGPSLTAVQVKATGISETLYGAGLATGLDWRSGRLYAGIDLRWHDTGRKHGVQYDGSAVGVKLGYNF